VTKPLPPSSAPAPPVGAATVTAPAPPATAAAAVAPHPVPVATHSTEALGWESLAVETEVASRPETAPLVATKPRSATKRLAQSSLSVTDRDRRRFWIIVASVSTVFVVAVIIVLIATIKTPAPDTHHRAGSDPRLLKVQSGAADAFDSIQKALKKAHRGATIELHDSRYEEEVKVDPTIAADITLRAAPGKQVVWTTRKGNDKGPMLHLSSAKGFKLEGKGITFDGRGQVATLIKIELHCPGLVLEDARLQGFTQTGIRFTNCWGGTTGETRLQLRGLEFATDKQSPELAAILLTIDPNVTDPASNGYIKIDSSCDFSGVPENSRIRLKKDAKGPGLLIPANP
jgi:hypothetical protein